MLATLGLEPQIGSTHELSLQELTQQITQSKAPWQQIKQGAPLPKAETAAPAVK